MRAPVYLFVFHLYHKQSSSDNRVVQARIAIYNSTFRLGSKTVAASETAIEL
jgi:hypothetical protein